LFSIALKKLRFIAFHGVHEEEKLLGNEFEVTVSVQFNEAGKVVALDDTINYATVFAMVKQRMEIPTALLETVAQDIAQALKAMDSRVGQVSVSIDKLRTPIQGLTGSASVTYTV
jgi:7,8-dihydroneopterin aldolase/epimerase/oxygenase